ncbi:MAG: hypothetical protein ACYS0E_14995 [Planctomycetota bacterium]|jgi:hypothetical protein
MSRRLLPLLFALIAACSGNIGDLFSVFPASAFEPEEPADGGDRPPTGSFEPIEVGFVGAGAGVTGNVRNIATASVNGKQIAFLSAGADGVHVVDVSTPGTFTSASYITTVDDLVLDGSPAAIAGGQVDDVAVVDDNYLVCIAVGTGAANAVTLFHIATLLDLAETSPTDLSGAFVPGTGNIAVEGTPEGNGGGASGSTGIFVVATGGSELGLASISAGQPGTWAALAPITSATPPIDNFIDIDLAFPAAYAVVAQGDDLALATFGIQLGVPPSIGIVGDLLPLTGSLSGFDSNAAAFPGTFPSTLARDVTGTLYVSEQNAIRIYSIANPTAPLESSSVFSAGFEIAGLAATTGFVARTNSANMTVYTTLAGAAAPVAALDTAGRRNLGIALANDAGGRYAFVCADTNGMRVVQWSDIP